jgi:hypothetical protein
MKVVQTPAQASTTVLQFRWKSTLSLVWRYICKRIWPCLLEDS